MTAVRRAVAALGIATASALLMWAAPVGAAARAPRLEFRPVIALLPAVSTAPTTAAVNLRAARAAVAECDDARVAQLAFVPTTRAHHDVTSNCVVLPEQPGGKNAVRYYLDKAAFTGKGTVHTAKAEFVPGQGWIVRLDLNAAGAKAWDRLAEQQFHRQVAIVLDGLVQSAPTIQPSDTTFSSFHGTAEISGSFTKKEAKALAAAARRANTR